MVVVSGPPRIRELSFQQLLNSRVSDLGLRPEDTLRECLIELRHELKRNGIEFFPHFYFGEEPWGCIDRTGSVEIPFYLANSHLRRLAERYYFSYSKQEIMMILRHEAGHAINYVYRLWTRPDWKKHFGNFRRRYPNFYTFEPNSREFVRYLHNIGNPHYAQKHPDEDFSESFAVWLDPASKWKWNYRRWKGALTKLQFVDRLFRREKIARRRPLKVRFDETNSYRRIDSTVAEYFAIEKKINPRIKEYTQDLKDIFPAVPTGRRGKFVRADMFVQTSSRYLEEELVTWIANADRRDIRKFLQTLKTICALNNLRLKPDEATEKLVELVIVATYHVMNRLRLLR
ncbi:MAG TPA: hypothetical protein VMW43_11275 [Bacteroidota bacterium]|nr:hypothetical protein [Bacteroidota bacterium]